MTTITSTLLRAILSLAFLSTSHSALSRVESTQWPQSHCVEADYWLTFAERKFCIDRARILSLEHLNGTSAALSMTIRYQEENLLVGLVALTDEQTTGGLHRHLNLTVSELLQQLQHPTLDEKEIALIKQIMDVDNDTEVRVFHGDGIQAYALLRTGDRPGTVYILHPQYSGAILLHGNLDHDALHYLLTHLRQGASRQQRTTD